MSEQPTAPTPTPVPDPALRQALTDVIRAQRLLDAFYPRVRAMLYELEGALLQANPALHVVPSPGRDIWSPASLSLDHPEGWLRRWLALFFAEPRWLAPPGISSCEGLKVPYLLVNLDPQSVAEPELDLVLLHGFTGVTGTLAGWLEPFWNRGRFDLEVPADGWYGRPEPQDLGFGATMNLQLRRVPLYRLTDRDALQREVVEPLLARYAQVG